MTVHTSHNDTHAINYVSISDDQIEKIKEILQTDQCNSIIVLSVDENENINHFSSFKALQNFRTSSDNQTVCNVALECCDNSDGAASLRIALGGDSVTTNRPTRRRFA